MVLTADEPDALVGDDGLGQLDAKLILALPAHAVACAVELEDVVLGDVKAGALAISHLDRDIHPVRPLAPHKLRRWVSHRLELRREKQHTLRRKNLKR